MGRRSLLLALLAIAALGCSRAGSRPGDILLITVDTLRADHTSLHGRSRDTTPHLRRWFGDHAIFDRAYATTAYTSPSITSLLSGLYPEGHRVRLFDQLVPADTVLLPQLLPAEYETAAFVANPVLTDAALGVADRFDHYDDGQTPGAHIDADDYHASSVSDAALQWLEEKRDRTRPLFLWVHYLDPHAPYHAPEEWPRRFRHDGRIAIPEGRVPTVAREPDVEDALDYVDAYDEEVAYTDAQVHRLLDGYARTSPIDEALIVFTSDHGETLIGRPIWFGHMWQVFEELVRVPLWMRGPGVEPGRRDGLVSGIDVAPTLLAFAGAAVPPTLTGRDLRTGPSDPDRVVFVETSIRFSHIRAAIRGHDKWVAKLKLGDRTVRSTRKFDLATDPGERRARPWTEDAEPARRLLDRIARDPDPGGAPADFQRGELGRQSRDALRELGYVE